jgi:hypothetical protein
MDTQQYIYCNTGVLLPISGGNGHSQDQAVILGSEAKYMLITIENEFISAMLDDGYWKKVEQSLIINDDGKKYDKITINNYLDDGAEVERVFWFDITECFGNN